MQTLFLGNFKKIFEAKTKADFFTKHLIENPAASNTRLSVASTDSPLLVDGFEITKNISDLLSPACGMTEEEKTSYLNRITAKLKSGKKLTSEEMRFLQAEYPALYQQAARIQAMRNGLENRLKSCRSKEEAHAVFSSALNGVSEKDPLKEYLIAAYQDAMNEFQKSDAYQKLSDKKEENTAS